MSASATHPHRPSRLASLALSGAALLGAVGALAVPAAGQADAAVLSTVKVGAGSKLKYELPIPFELNCSHHVTAFSDDTNVFDVQVPNGFTKHPKVTIEANYAGLAVLNFMIEGKDTFEGSKGDCTGSYSNSIAVRVLPDDNYLANEVSHLLKDSRQSLRLTFKANYKAFDEQASQLVDDYKHGDIALDPALESLNTAYFDYSFNSVLTARIGLTAAAQQVDNLLASEGATPGFVGGHSQHGAWGMWDMHVMYIAQDAENAAQKQDKTMWDAWKKISKLTEDPDEVPEFTLARYRYDYFHDFGGAPPNSGDWVQSAPRHPASIYYLIGYAKECDPESGGFIGAGLSDPSAALSGELHIGSDTLAADFSADVDGVWKVDLGVFGTYGHSYPGDGSPSDPVPSGLARYDVFYEGEVNPTDSAFITIP